MAQPALLLDIQDVDFGYEGEPSLLERFNMRVEQGEFVTLLGPSGCGKSTIMNLTAGLLRPLAGSISFGGLPLAGLNRNVGYMTQGDTLLPWATVARNIQLPLELRKVPRAERTRRVEDVMRLVNLYDARDKYPSELSGGMKRRALLARSIVYEPAMLLMDEPFGALDAQLRETMHQELLNAVARTGQGVLFVTHDITESALLADRILVLGGAPLEVIDECRLPYGKSRDLADIRVSKEHTVIENRLRDALRKADAATRAARP